MIAWAQMGDANASIPTRSRCCPGRCSAPTARSPAATSRAFVAPAALDDGLADRLAVRPPAGRRSPTRARLTQGRHAAERRAARDRGRPRHVHRPDRRRGRRAASRPPSCRWPSATSCSDDAVPALAARCSPTGGSPPAGHAHSGGLEAAVAAGRRRTTPASLRDVPASAGCATAGRGRRRPARPRACGADAATLARARRGGRRPDARRRRCGAASRRAGPRRCCAPAAAAWPSTRLATPLPGAPAPAGRARASPPRPRAAARATPRRPRRYAVGQRPGDRRRSGCSASTR